jgi:hypothetical protein
MVIDPRPSLTERVPSFGAFVRATDVVGKTRAASTTMMRSGLMD